MTLSGHHKCQLAGADSELLAALVQILSGWRHNYWQPKFSGVGSVSNSGRPSLGSTAPGIYGRIASRGRGGIVINGGGGHLHIIITSACKDLLLNYIQIETFIEEELRSTNYCRSVNFNWQRGFLNKMNKISATPVLREYNRAYHCPDTNLFCYSLPCYLFFFIWKAPLGCIKASQLWVLHLQITKLRVNISFENEILLF